jgi:coenzyme F420-0:L-glutamate ligase/coenzyme F420-1:gamma-L-glutamate ligase
VTADDLTIRAVAWPEIIAGHDLVGLLSEDDDLTDGDVVVITSKVVSKAEGRQFRGDRTRGVVDETVRTVARRGTTIIGETPHGLVMAAAGVDASNTPPGTYVLLPVDPDASAGGLRSGLLASVGKNVAVIVSDTAGRAWRIGQTDIAVGCAGIASFADLRGSRDTHGNELVVTMPAIADEIAAAADLTKGKASGCPVAVVRGLGAHVLAPGEHGPGARALVRAGDDDLFGLGARDAVSAAAYRSDPQALDHFPLPAHDEAPFRDLLERWTASLPVTEAEKVRARVAREGDHPVTTSPSWVLCVDVRAPLAEATVLAVGRLLERADVLAAAHRLVGTAPADEAAGIPSPGAGWRRLVVRRWDVR